MRLPRPSLALVALLLVGLGIGLERWIVTDGEAVEDVLDRAARRVQAEDFDGLRDLLSETYEGEGGDREGAVARARSAVRSWRPTGLSVAVLQVDVERVPGGMDRARAPAVVSGAVLGRPFRLHVEVELVRQPGGWRIDAARVVDWSGA